ncbi:unnamed protein product, partial [Scytosiphon promiscuus]
MACEQRWRSSSSLPAILDKCGSPPLPDYSYDHRYSSYGSRYRNSRALTTAARDQAARVGGDRSASDADPQTSTEHTPRLMQFRPCNLSYCSRCSRLHLSVLTLPGHRHYQRAKVPKKCERAKNVPVPDVLGPGRKSKCFFDTMLLEYTR